MTMAAGRMTVVDTADLDVLIEAAGEWLRREEQYARPPDQRRRVTSAARRRDRVRDVIERTRARLRIFGG